MRQCMSTIRDIQNIFHKEWERKAKEDNLEFIATGLQTILNEYILGSRNNQKISAFNLETCLDPFELDYKNYTDIIPSIKENTGLIITFEDSGNNLFHTLRDFLVYILKESKISADAQHSIYAPYFFKLRLSEIMPLYVDKFTAGMDDRLLYKFSQKIDFLQSIINRGFSYTSERLTYFHSIGLKYERFEFEKIIYPVINEGKVPEFLFLTILYRVVEILCELSEEKDNTGIAERMRENLMQRVKSDNADFLLCDIGINTTSQMAKIFDKFLRLAIRYLPNEKDELESIKKVEDVFNFVIYMLHTELGVQSSGN